MNWYRTGMNWYPPPRSRFEGVARLLPSQILDLSHGAQSLVHRPLVCGLADGWSYEQKVDFLQSRLETAFRNIPGLGQVWIPLTGGVDSRLVVALAKHLRLLPQIYTFWKPFGRFPRGDCALPPLLAKEIGFEHQLIKGDRFSRKRAARFDEHTGKHSMDPDRYYFAHGHWDQIPHDATIVPGNVFVLGHFRYGMLYTKPVTKAERFLRDRDPPSSPEEIASRIMDGFAFARYHRGSRQHYSGISDWARWIWAHPEQGLDWRDRFTIEQRLAGDLSSTEQGLDLVGPTRMHLVNSTAMISALLSLPEEVKAVAQHHENMIGRLAPELLTYPFNPPDSRSNLAAINLRKRVDESLRARDKIRRLVSDAPARVRTARTLDEQTSGNARSRRATSDRGFRNV